MPVVVKAKKTDSTSDMIRKFKKLVGVANVIDIYRAREYHFKPSAIKNIEMNELKRQKRRRKRLTKLAKGIK